MSTLIAGLQDRIGYVFQDRQLLEQALTHRSFGAVNNERLEFLGDAILDLAIGEWLYHRFPDCTEGDLSHLRAAIVCGENLAAIAHSVNLGEVLRLGAGEARSGGRQRQSILADAVEALLAAVYLDGGMAHCRQLVDQLFAAQLAAVKLDAGKDAKTRLQELVQARRWQLPVYQLIARSGQDHAASFRVACTVPEAGLQAEAEAGSRKKAEQAAAAEILCQLENCRAI